jgi:hypothetical protein
MFTFDLKRHGMSLTNLRNTFTNIFAYATIMTTGVNDGNVSNRYDIRIETTPGVLGTTWTMHSSNPLRRETRLVNSVNAINWTSDKQEVNFLVANLDYAEGATKSSMLIDNFTIWCRFSDYIDFNKANVVKINKSTGEIKLHFPPTCYRKGVTDVVEVDYKYYDFNSLLCPSESGVIVLKEADDAIYSDVTPAFGGPTISNGGHKWLAPSFICGLDSGGFSKIGYSTIPIDIEKKDVNTLHEISISGKTYKGMSNLISHQEIKYIPSEPGLIMMYYLVLIRGEIFLLVFSTVSSPNYNLYINSVQLYLQANAFLVPLRNRQSIFLNEIVKKRKTTVMPVSKVWGGRYESIAGYVNSNFKPI